MAKIVTLIIFTLSAVMLQATMLSIFILIAVMLDAIMLRVFILNVFFILRNLSRVTQQIPYSECSSAEGRYAECRGAQNC